MGVRSKFPRGAGITGEHFRIGSSLATSGNLSVRGSPFRDQWRTPHHAEILGYAGRSGVLNGTFPRRKSYVFLQDLHVAHTAATATRNGRRPLILQRLTNPFLDRVWVSGFDTCIKAGGAFFYGELRQCRNDGLQCRGLPVVRPIS
jgi:hypothetical protein